MLPPEGCHHTPPLLEGAVVPSVSYVLLSPEFFMEHPDTTVEVGAAVLKGAPNEIPVEAAADE